MAIPDPYVNENFLVTHIAPLASEDVIPADRIPYGNNSASVAGSYYLTYATYKGLQATEPVEIQEVFDADDAAIDKFIKDVNSEYLTYNSIIVGCHLKNVLFRTSWIYSMRRRLPWPEFSRLSQNIDIVDKFNGPAILTAEERYSFRTDVACELLDIDTTGFHVTQQLWSLCRKIMEYKI